MSEQNQPDRAVLDFTIIDEDYTPIDLSSDEPLDPPACNKDDQECESCQ